jgi:hypothetical protein
MRSDMFFILIFTCSVLNYNFFAVGHSPVIFQGTVG